MTRAERGGGEPVPGGYADFVRDMIRELQRRGLYRSDYTLRENLGPPRPAVGAWKLSPGAKAAAE
jgi:hypothetical protein